MTLCLVLSSEQNKHMTVLRSENIAKEEQKFLVEIGKRCLLRVTCRLNFVDQISNFHGVFRIKETLPATGHQEADCCQLFNLLVVRRLHVEKRNGCIRLSNNNEFALLCLKKVAHFCFALSLLIISKTGHGIPAFQKNSSRHDHQESARHQQQQQQPKTVPAATSKMMTSVQFLVTKDPKKNGLRAKLN